MEAHAPGGLGVFMLLKFPRTSALLSTGVLSSSPSSSVSDERGGGGRSGMFRGGEGVWNSILEVWKEGLRGGVCREREKEGRETGGVGGGESGLG